MTPALTSRHHRLVEVFEEFAMIGKNASYIGSITVSCPSCGFSCTWLIVSVRDRRAALSCNACQKWQLRVEFGERP